VLTLRARAGRGPRHRGLPVAAEGRALQPAGPAGRGQEARRHRHLARLERRHEARGAGCRRL